jgi:hypothetical protein
VDWCRDLEVVSEAVSEGVKAHTWETPRLGETWALVSGTELEHV